jgi:hypothetical protein
MGFMDKAKAAAEQAATRATEAAEEMQTKVKLTRAYGDLGRVAFELLESGEISHDRLTPLADEIRRIRAESSTDG